MKEFEKGYRTAVNDLLAERVNIENERALLKKEVNKALKKAKQREAYATALFGLSIVFIILIIILTWRFKIILGASL